MRATGPAPRVSGRPSIGGWRRRAVAAAWQGAAALAFLIAHPAGRGDGLPRATRVRCGLGGAREWQVAVAQQSALSAPYLVIFDV